MSDNPLNGGLGRRIPIPTAVAIALGGVFIAVFVARMNGSWIFGDPPSRLAHDQRLNRLRTSDDGSPRCDGFCAYIDNPVRDRHPRTRLILEGAKVVPGMHVVDIGAGVGYYAFKFAEMVGPKGHVLATETDPEMVEVIRFEAEIRGVRNLEARVVDEDDDRMGLDLSRADVIVVSNVPLFDHCDGASNRKKMNSLHEALVPGGRLVIQHEEYRIRPPSECGVSAPEEVLTLALDVGLELVRFEYLAAVVPSPAGKEPGWRPGFHAVFARKSRPDGPGGAGTRGKDAGVDRREPVPRG